MKIVGIAAPLGESGLRRMLDALGSLYNIRFEERKVADDAGICALIIPEADRESTQEMWKSKVPWYAVIKEDERISCGNSSVVYFSKHPSLPNVLKGREIVTNEAVDVKGLPNWVCDGAVLASKGGARIWSRQKVDGKERHFVTVPIPEFGVGEAIFQYFNEKRFLALLPLILFLKSLDDDCDWDPPPLQSCFMFDDPNLHWRKYGHIDFAEVVEHSKLNNYHVSFATIPLDCWFMHRPTVALFKKNSKRVSLLIHGNDHIRKELAIDRTDKDICRILRQGTFAHCGVRTALRA
jgi:hypothetical protein